MSIRNTTLNTNGSEHLHSGYVNNAGRVGQNSPANKASSDKTHSSNGDSVQISDAGRAAASQTQELNFARAALQSEASSPEREAEIRDRIASGYYQQPEVAKEIAAAVTQDLLGSNNEL